MLQTWGCGLFRACLGWSERKSFKKSNLKGLQGLGESSKTSSLILHTWGEKEGFTVIFLARVAGTLTNPGYFSGYEGG